MSFVGKMETKGSRIFDLEIEDTRLRLPARHGKCSLISVPSADSRFIKSTRGWNNLIGPPMIVWLWHRSETVFFILGEPSHDSFLDTLEESALEMSHPYDPFIKVEGNSFYGTPKLAFPFHRGQPKVREICHSDFTNSFWHSQTEELRLLNRHSTEAAFQNWECPDVCINSLSLPSRMTVESPKFQDSETEADKLSNYGFILDEMRKLLEEGKTVIFEHIPIQRRDFSDIDSGIKDRLTILPFQSLYTQELPLSHADTDTPPRSCTPEHPDACPCFSEPSLE